MGKSPSLLYFRFVYFDTNNLNFILLQVKKIQQEKKVTMEMALVPLTAMKSHRAFTVNFDVEMKTFWEQQVKLMQSQQQQKQQQQQGHGLELVLYKKPNTSRIAREQVKTVTQIKLIEYTQTHTGSELVLYNKKNTIIVTATKAAQKPQYKLIEWKEEGHALVQIQGRRYADVVIDRTLPPSRPSTPRFTQLTY